MDSNPYERAQANGDVQAIQRWEHFRASLSGGYAVTLAPSCFYGFSDPRNPEEANQRDLDLSKAMLRDAYRSSFRSVLDRHHENLELTAQPYFPPGAYEHGSAVSDIWEVLTAVQSSGAADLAWDVAANLIADWIVESIGTLKAAMDVANIPGFRRQLPPHHPAMVRAACESHALRTFPELLPTAGRILEPFEGSADYPNKKVILTIVVPLQHGKLVYVVNSRLDPLSLLKVTPEDTQLLDTVSWKELFSLTHVNTQ